MFPKRAFKVFHERLLLRIGIFAKLLALNICLKRCGIDSFALQVFEGPAPGRRCTGLGLVRDSVDKVLCALSM